MWTVDLVEFAQLITELDAVGSFEQPDVATALVSSNSLRPDQIDELRRRAAAVSQDAKRRQDAGEQVYSLADSMQRGQEVYIRAYPPGFPSGGVALSGHLGNVDHEVNSVGERVIIGMDLLLDYTPIPVEVAVVNRAGLEPQVAVFLDGDPIGPVSATVTSAGQPFETRSALRRRTHDTLMRLARAGASPAYLSHVAADLAQAEDGCCSDDTHPALNPQPEVVVNVSHLAVPIGLDPEVWMKPPSAVGAQPDLDQTVRLARKNTSRAARAIMPLEVAHADQAVLLASKRPSITATAQAAVDAYPGSGGASIIRNVVSELVADLYHLADAFSINLDAPPVPRDVIGGSMKYLVRSLRELVDATPAAPDGDARSFDELWADAFSRYARELVAG